MSLTQKWLGQQVQPYPNANRVYADVDSTLTRFTTLRPKSDVYTFDDGRSQLLLCVHGLLPISFRGASYNIPMAFWVTKEYPKHPPISYVVPTNDMLVKPGKYVDVSGRCNTEYIQNWERKDEGCNLSALLESLQDHFSREPPVYSKPKDDDQVRNSDSQPRSTGHHLGSSPDRPVLPSKPPSMTSTAVDPASTLTNNVPSSSAKPQSAPPPPRPPPHPVVRLGTNYGLESPQPSASPFRRVDPHVIQKSLSSRPLLSPNPSALSRPPPPPIPPYHVVTTHPHGTLTDLPRQLHPPIPDLLDQDDIISFADRPLSVPAPPRPPNPELLRLHAQVHEKLKSELISLTKTFALDAAKLRAHQSDLLLGEPAIKDEMARLEAVRDVCRNVSERTGQAIRQAEASITELRRKGDPEVDELVCATNIVHNQLINLIADDNAIEDTIYHLHRALNVGRIDLDRFLRFTRILAEEQFMKRALIEKIQTNMSYVPVSSIAPDWT